MSTLPATQPDSHRTRPARRATDVRAGRREYSTRHAPPIVRRELPATSRQRIGHVVGPGPEPAAVYRRRRRVLGAAVAAVLVALGLDAQAAVGGPSGGPASAAGTGSIVVETRHVVARPGDSLWTIAETHRGDVGVRSYVDALIDLNGGTVIHVGQLVRLP